MKKLLSLIKATMTDNMSLFKIKNKSQSKVSKIATPILLSLCVFFAVWTYAEMFMDALIEVHMEHVVLTLFVVVTFLLTLIEGVYKSGNLLFNCKDDNLLLSLPIKRMTVLFIRVFKFYVFELMYNSLFLLPAMVVYATRTSVNSSFYLVSFIMLLLLPVIPIVISCILGVIITATASKFKHKNFAQIIISVIMLMGVFYISFNLQNVVNNLASNAQSVNDAITKLYYPAQAYVKMVLDFNIMDLLLFIIINVALFIVMIIGLENIYFKTNSKSKNIKTNKNGSHYKIKSNHPIIALVSKEFKRFINSPVFVINAGFGLVIYIVGCIIFALKYESYADLLISEGIIALPELVREFIPLLLFEFICFGSLMSSITCSMISLEGKSFSILKSLPVSPTTIIFSKVLSAVIIMLPFIFVGDLIVFARFHFKIIEIFLILLASLVLPFVAETIGIIINLKYPKMDAENDTEVVKQSMSSMVAVFTGMIMTGLTIYLVFKAIGLGISAAWTLISGVAFYVLLFGVLILYVRKNGIKEFNNINV